MTLFLTSESKAKLSLYEIHDRQAGWFSLCMSDEVCIFFYSAVFISYQKGKKYLFFNIKM